MRKKSIRLGVDIGGTFTDLVLEVDDAQFISKMLTTHTAPDEAIVAGALAVCKKADIEPRAIRQVIHGTTLATNALIERNGAKTALVTTSGFRDVIEMRTESRFDQYDINLSLPPPLLPRHQRFVLKERVAANGDVLLPLAEADIVSLASTLRYANFESIGVGFIHAYANDAHERRVRDVFAAELPGVAVSLSSEVSPQMREYERFNTVAANAYIKPMMKGYLSRLRERLAAIGIDCPVFLMHSGGGIISLESAAEFPVRLVESGPAGGAVFAAHVAARHGLEKVLSFDMGGTTAKICLIKNQTPKTSRVFEVARTYRFKKGSGMPISIPVIDMVEIGAGGGSLASVDALRQIRVGPDSAGSEPGPACYARGGDRAAVTDADLLLGRLDPEDFAGGSLKLDRELAAQALDATVAKPLSLTAETAAYGVSEVVDENMSNAARVHAVENGEDLADYTMVAFGGAAPLHAGRLCEKLGIDRLLIPEGAGVGSAIGFLRAPFSFEANKSLFMTIEDYDAESVRRVLASLEDEATSFVRSCVDDANTDCEYRVFMRYAGQGFEIPVAFDKALAQEPDASAMKGLFEAQYEALFGRVVDGMSVEMTVWSVNVATRLPPVARVASVSLSNTVADSPTREIYDPANDRLVSASALTREALAAGDAVSGPAAITERETTTIVPSSRRAVVQEDGCIDVRVK
ncbi:MAG: hydantoinase/oxoprolinase family protein [Pseudomonadota bacterium]